MNHEELMLRIGRQAFIEASKYLHNKFTETENKMEEETRIT